MVSAPPYPGEEAALGPLPMSPFRVVGPVFVMAVSAKTTKVPAVPSGTSATAAWAVLAATTSSEKAARVATASCALPLADIDVWRFILCPFTGGTHQEG